MWLIQEDVSLEMERLGAIGVNPTQAQIEQFMAVANEPVEAAAARIRRGTGATAEVNVDGLLTERPSFLAMLLGMGGTSYQAIRAALADADNDPNVSGITLNVRSPGGHIDGLFDTIEAIKQVKKPILVRASNASSAAYALAAAAGRIEATSPAATFGSVGVVKMFSGDDKSIEITNTDSPNKRPDVKADEGKKVVREELDAHYRLFANAIAEGRAYHAKDESIDAARVTESFGRGSTLLAAQAKKLKMIDRAPEPVVRQVPSLVSGQTKATESVPMNLEQLKANHPELYATVLNEGKALGRTEGEAAERDRVVAHLTLGNQSGALDVAHAAIEAGDGLTATVQAKYMAASLNRRDSNARQADSDAAGAVVDGATPPAGKGATAEGGKDLGDQIVELMAKERGKKVA
jgi:ClpP class serine protease